jgi:hypothetical protein
MGDLALALRRATPTDIAITATFTRPNDTTPYSVGDVIADSASAATMLTFQNVARKPGGSFFLHRAVWIWSQSGSVNKPDLDLLLFNATMANPPDDNAALAASDAESETFVGCITIQGLTYAKTLNSAATSGGNMVVESEYLGKLLVCAPGTQNLYCVPRVLNSAGYTPVAQEKFTFILFGEQRG